MGESVKYKIVKLNRFKGEKKVGLMEIQSEKVREKTLENTMKDEDQERVKLKQWYRTYDTGRNEER